MKTYLKIILSLIFFSFLIPFLVEAITIINPLKQKTFGEVINAIIDFIFWAAVLLVPLIIIIAAFYFLTSGGNPEKINTAKRIIFGRLSDYLLFCWQKQYRQ